MTNLERVIILEEDYPFFKKVELKVDSIDSNIEVGKIEKISLVDKVSSHKFLADKIILALSSRRSTTIENYFTINRDNPDTPISSSELDSLIFKGLWNFLDKHRGWASSKMRISDMDMTLESIEILSIVIDSRNVVNPLNVKGSNFSIKIRGTFIPRDVLSFISELPFFDERLLVVERSSAISSFLSPKKGVVINPDGLETNIFKNEDIEIKFESRKKWALSSLVEIVNKELSINEDQSLPILDRYLKGEVSKNFDKHISGKLRKSFNMLGEIIDSIKTNKAEKVFANVSPEILAKVPHKNKKVDHADFEEILKSKGFSVIIKDDESIMDSMNKDYLALVGFHLFSSPHNEDLNNILQRRSKWLVPNNK